MAVSLVAYAGTVIVASRAVGRDVGLLCLLLLLALLAISVARDDRPRRFFDRAAAYVIVMLLVYLDQTSAGRDEFFNSLSWLLLGTTVVAAVVRFCCYPARRFEITGLDLLVVFIALVMPNLPGSLQLPPDLSAGVAKAVVLLYVVEMLLAIDLKWPVTRVVLAATLTVIAVRSVFPTGI
jgi:UDP-GlcNAc:undecaprenyl-phosphate/decaprenyl-phosphate GlcNAc-1-phosphate transferase